MQGRASPTPMHRLRSLNNRGIMPSFIIIIIIILIIIVIIIIVVVPYSSTQAGQPLAGADVLSIFSHGSVIIFLIISVVSTI